MKKMKRVIPVFLMLILMSAPVYMVSLVGLKPTT